MLKQNAVNKNKKENFKIILADTDIETFEKLENLFKKYDFINLSSEFAVNFVMESERIDLIIISKRISGITKIVGVAKKKKIPIYIVEEDLELKINEKEIDDLIKEEMNKKSNKRNGKFNFSFRIKFIRISDDKKISEDNFSKSSARNLKSSNGIEEIKSKNIKNGITLKKEIREIDVKNTNAEGNFINNINKANNKHIRAIKQSVIIFVKAKGGVGSTIMALCLGLAFKDVKTLLVDFNFFEGGGDLSYYLDLPKSPNILNFSDEYSGHSLKNSIIKIDNSLDIIQTPPTFEMSRKIELQDIYCLVDIARKRYHLLIFDMPNKLDDIWFGVVDMADMIVLVSDSSPGSIGRLANINNRFFYNDLNRILVINRFNKFANIKYTQNLREYFANLSDLLLVEECEVLNNKFDFMNFDLNNLKGIKIFFEKIFHLLSCD